MSAHSKKTQLLMLHFKPHLNHTITFPPPLKSMLVTISELFSAKIVQWECNNQARSFMFYDV